MLKDLKDYVNDSPVLSGGLAMLGIVVAIVVLFAVGAVAGSWWDRATGRSGGEARFSSRLGSTPTASIGSTVTSSPQGGVVSGAPAGADGAPAVAADVVADAMAVAKKPGYAKSQPSAQSPSWLASNFGARAAPLSIGGLTRTSVSGTDTTVTAMYAATNQGSSVQSARLVLAKVPRSMKAGTVAEGLLSEFDLGRVAYDWGGREITQGMTNESRLDLYPPALCLVWPVENYVVQLTVIPAEPGRATAARVQSLEAINDLSY